MKKSSISALLIPLLAACASTSSTNPDNSSSSKRAKSEFSLQMNGAQYQSVTGLYCPGEVMGGKLKSTRVYDDKATDVSCGYKGAGTTTVYLTKAPEESFSNYFQASMAAIPQGSIGDRVEYKKDATDNCMIQNQLMSSFGELLAGGNKSNTINIDMSGETGNMPYKIGVFGGDTTRSYVAVSPVDDKYMKIRYTIDSTFSEEQADEDCRALHTLMRDLVASVGVPEGKKAPGTLSDLLNNMK